MATTLTMWDFSWLVRAHGAEAEYADLERVLDELAERDYDVVRIDAYPHLIAAGSGGGRRERTTVLPQADWLMWGNHAPVEVEPAAALVRFLALARERGRRVALASWFLEDEDGRAAAVVTPADFARGWGETLALIEREGLLDVVACVDLANEWPIASWCGGAHAAIFGAGGRGGVGERWSARELTGIASYFTAIDPLRERWPQLRYTFSFADAFPSLRELDVSRFDLLDVHLWLDTADEEWARRTEPFAPTTGEPGALQRHVDLVWEAYWPERDRWLGALLRSLDAQAAWARERGLALWTTESWASVIWEGLPTPDGRDAWDYVRDVSEIAAVAAAQRGWEGICSSSFSQPHFPGMWDDASWHRRLNARVRGAAGG